MTLKPTIIKIKQSQQSIDEWPKHWEPSEAQEKALRIMMAQGGAGLLLDPGLGKTSCILAAAKIFKKKKLIRKTLVIAPLRVCYLVWPEEQKKWIDFENLKVTILHGKDKEHHLKEDVDIYCINPEGLPWLLSKGFKNLGFDMLVVDESTMFKHTGTERFKNLKQILKLFARRYILTGTPTPKSLMDLFGQLYVIDMGNALGQYITHYRNKYFHPSGFGGYDWQLRKGAEEEIYAAIRPVTLRLEAEDYIKMPINMPPINIQVNLPAAARKIYDEMEKELLIAIETKRHGEKLIVAETAASASMKCRQIANGGIYDEHKNEHTIHEAKTQAVLELVSELSGAPVLVAYEFGHDLRRLLKAFGKNTPYIGGGVNPKRSAEIERAWNAGKIPVLLGQPAAMGHGLNLQGSGNHVIWHSLTWNFEHYDQFNRRIRRQGQKHERVFTYHIVAKDTIDEDVLASLATKDSTQKALLNALKDRTYKKLSKNDKKSLYISEELSDNSNESIKLTRRSGSASIKPQETLMSEDKASKVAAKKPVVVNVKSKKITDGEKAPAKSAMKAPAAKKAAVVKASKIKEADTRKLKLLVKENPKREGTKAYEIFEKYKGAKTVQDFLDAGGKLSNIRWDEKAGHLEVA